MARVWGYKAKALDTGQEDNIIRDGVLTTEQAYDMFKRAGMNTKEWLEKVYGKNPRQPNEEEMRLMEEVITEEKDKTDTQETINNINENLKKINNKKEELKKEREIISAEIIKQQEKQENIDKKEE